VRAMHVCLAMGAFVSKPEQKLKSGRKADALLAPLALSNNASAYGSPARPNGHPEHIAAARERERERERAVVVAAGAARDGYR